MGLPTFVPQCDRNKSDYYYVLTRLNHTQQPIEYTHSITGGRLYMTVSSGLTPLFVLEFTNIVDVAKGILNWTKIMKLLYRWKKLFYMKYA